MVLAKAHDFSGIQTDNHVRRYDGAEMVRYNKAGSVLHEFLESHGNFEFTFRVNLTHGFIKNQNGWIAQNGPGNGNTLALATGKPDAGLPYAGVIAFRKGTYEFIRIAFNTGGENLIPGGVAAAIRDVIVNRIRKEKRFLGYQSDLLA